MAGNDLTNASFLDGTGGWTAVGGTLSVDEGQAGRGGKGRAVLVASRVATSGGQTAGARSTGVAVTAGQTLEVAGLYGSTGASVELALAIYSGVTLISRTVLPKIRSAAGVCRQGAPELLNAAYALMAAPQTGLASVEVVATSGGAGAFEAWLSKPYLDAVWEDRKAYVWDPGLFANPDLSAMRRWPAHFPPILLEGYGNQKTKIREAFSGDSDREGTLRKAGLPAINVTGRMHMTLAQYADLEDFHTASDDPFLFVRPETAQLCRATWRADGNPDDEPTGVGTVYGMIGLQLVVL
ncbi:hypothetical protein [Caulobacter sp. Root343]|uniref:hypothetical protein n=1 Tax=Caulobacter sp. Root343 TaxID=1736520 RepID=UPI0006F92869|nr:hypothetical protein [Caulobacter sp. Root343]KQV66643.1 hypothetical protein ASC70_12480 [Caulobacter sp. Root343]